MGDFPSGARLPVMDNATAGFARDGDPSASSSTLHKSHDDNDPFYSQLSALHQGQLRPDFRSPMHPATLYQSQEHDASPLNMGSMVNMLPSDYAIPDDASLKPNSQTASRTLNGVSPSAIAYQNGPHLQMPLHASGNQNAHSSYGPGFATGPYQQNLLPSQGSQLATYPSLGNNHGRFSGPTSMQSSYQHYTHAPPYMYYPAPYGHQGQYAPAFPMQNPQSQAQAMYGRRVGLTNPPFGTQGQNMDYIHNEGTFPGVRMGQGSFTGDSTQGSYQNGTVPLHGTPYAQAPVPRSSLVNSIPRGPPRKPKQSGHALWVGNLPPGTTVMALKDHFSRDATKDIESLFLISKSNCAFVNYRTEETCTAAMHRFHDSRFNGVRLVCRLRRSSGLASGVPTGPSAMVGSQQQSFSRPATPKTDSVAASQEDGVEALSQECTKSLDPPADVTSKYFIVKSLTLQDLELSVRNGIWATQSHNEEVLNKAYQSTENVYLIFSANKSGEYFGYARMASPILEDGSHSIGSAPKPESILHAPDVPKSIPTPATEWAPRGKIIDDSARGTIFWEAELSASEGEDETPEPNETSQVDGEGSVVAQSWGKPFKIEWISTNRLPFYRTRGLRNPWNANREVKIARDGTELEPGVGERLIHMFHRLGPSTAAGAAVLPTLGGSGLAQVRPF